jgi:hypothetical protein
MKTKIQAIKTNSKDLNLKNKKVNGFDSAIINLGIKIIPLNLEKE